VTVIRVGSAYGPRDRLLADRNYVNTLTPIAMWPRSCNPRYAVTHTYDIAELAILAATSEKAAGQVYNVSGPRVVTLKDFARAMGKAQGGPRVWLEIPYPVVYFVASVMEDFARLRRARGMPFLNRYYLRTIHKEGYVDGSKARRELGWEEKISLEEGARLYVAWRRSRKGR
jgi:nucleoside-diphosphate-sugar epimerase